MISRKNMQRGFALPTVVVASVMLMMVMTAALSSVANLRTSTNSQHYQRIAREAAESGVEHAKHCLEQGATWTDPLRPEGGETCDGSATQCSDSDSCYVFKDGSLSTTYEVMASTSDGGNTYLVSSKGLAQSVRETTGAVWQEQGSELKVRIGKKISLERVVFGYSGYANAGAYFFVLKNNPIASMDAVGYNDDGQLGTGNFNSVLIPAPAFVGRSPKAVFTNFVSMGFNAFIIDNSGDVYGSGENFRGQLGNGSLGAPLTKVSNSVKFILPFGVEGKYVASTGNTTYVLATNNRVYSAGVCMFGQLGTGIAADTSATNPAACPPRPDPAPVALPAVNLLDDNTIPISISADASMVLVTMKGGAVYGWGYNGNGGLGTGTDTSTATPSRVKVGHSMFSNYFGDLSLGQPKVIKAVTDGNTSYFLTDDGDIWAAGSNNSGQLGSGSFDPTTMASGTATVKMIRPPGKKYVDVQTDQFSVQMLTEDGEVWGAGRNIHGNLGNGSLSNVVNTPQKFNIPTKAVALYTTAIYDPTGVPTPEKNVANTFVIDENGKVWGSGSNNFGQLGNNATISLPSGQSVPVEMLNVSGVVEVQSGYGTTVVVTNTGVVYTVGNNANGQLGDGSTVSKSIPLAHPYTNTATPMYY